MSPASGRLPGVGVLRFTGADALAFLQGQISNDTRRLERGEPLLAACSSPQGRVFAVLRLLPHSTGVLALLPRELAAAVAGRLGKYVLRSKVRVENASDEFAVAGLHGTQSVEDAGFEAVGSALSAAGATGPAYRESDDGIGMAAVAAAATIPRYWVVAPTAAIAARGLLGEADENAWRLADIADGLPQVYADTAELFVAQMLNLDLLDGISFTKGCFTGQEIIARTQHLGRIKRRMFRVRLPDAPWRIGGPVQLVDGRSGRLTELARGGDGFEALAVLPLTAAATADSEPAATETTSDAATAAHRGIELPLPYALTLPS
jgi:folate-binding protein YgfZ